MVTAMSHSTVGKRIPSPGRRQPEIWMRCTAEKWLCYKRAHKCSETIWKVESLKERKNLVLHSQSDKHSNSAYYNNALHQLCCIDVRAFLISSYFHLQIICLRWLEIVPSTYILMGYGIKKLPNHWWTRCYHFCDTIGYPSNIITC